MRLVLVIGLLAGAVLLRDGQSSRASEIDADIRPVSTPAQVCGFTCINVIPSAPTTIDPVQIRVTGEVPDNCWGVTSSHSVAGNQIAVTVTAVYTAPPGTICTQIPAPFSVTRPIGLLAADAYSVQVTTYHPWCSSPCVDTTTFSVTFVQDTDGDGVGDSSDNCPTVPNPGQQDIDRDLLGDACDPDDDNDTHLDGADNCPTSWNVDQSDFDGDGLGDRCDFDDDSDGFTDNVEDVHPWCGNLLNDDTFDDSVENDGCLTVPGGVPGPPKAGNYSEWELMAIGTSSHDPCGADGWPADLADTGASANRVTLLDVTSFVAPLPKKLNTQPGDPGFNARWDLVPGTFTGNWIVLTDLTSLVAGPTAFPPMLGGVKAFNGPACPWAP